MAAWLIILLFILSGLAVRATPIWLDAGRRGAPWPQRLRCILVGIVAPSRYWWGARIEAMSAEERADLLSRETASLGVNRADSLPCPLCGTEVPHAWALDAEGQPTIAPGPVKCPQCDFRLDACRHCAHFLPGSPRTGLATSDDLTYGRCSFYKTTQPVDQVASPEIAKRLKDRGYESLRSPTPIVDSFVPLDYCRAFQPERKRLRIGGVRWPDARRAALLRLLTPTPAVELPSSDRAVSDEEQWLL